MNVGGEMTIEKTAATVLMVLLVLLVFMTQARLH
jgi:hypothetical protein